MVKSILLTILVFFAVWGICELIYRCKILVYHPDEKFKTYIFVLLKSRCALEQLRYLWEKIRWCGDEFTNGIIAITDEINEEELKSCEEFNCDKNIILCSSEDLTILYEKINGDKNGEYY